MAPPPAAAIAGIAALVHRNVPVALMSEQVGELFLGQLGYRLGDLDAGIVDESVEPELGYGGSHCGSHVGAGADVASQRNRAVPKSWAAARAPSSSTSAITTPAPPARSRRAIANPMPRPAPVTSVRRPLRSASVNDWGRTFSSSCFESYCLVCCFDEYVTAPDRGGSSACDAKKASPFVA